MTNITPKDILKEIARDFEDLGICGFAGMELCEELSELADEELNGIETEEALFDIFAGLNSTHDMLVQKFLEFFAARGSGRKSDAPADD